jgi:hypothetical protein
VIRAVEVCPARAIALRRLATTVLTPDTGPIPQVTPAAGVPTAPRATTSTESALRTGGLPIFPAAAGGEPPAGGHFPVVQPIRTTTHRSRGRAR